MKLLIEQKVNYAQKPAIFILRHHGNGSNVTRKKKSYLMG